MKGARALAAAGLNGGLRNDCVSTIGCPPTVRSAHKIADAIDLLILYWKVVINLCMGILKELANVPHAAFPCCTYPCSCMKGRKDEK